MISDRNVYGELAHTAPHRSRARRNWGAALMAQEAPVAGLCDVFGPVGAARRTASLIVCSPARVAACAPRLSLLLRVCLVARGTLEQRRRRTLARPRCCTQLRALSLSLSRLSRARALSLSFSVAPSLSLSLSLSPLSVCQSVCLPACLCRRHPRSRLSAHPAQDNTHKKRHNKVVLIGVRRGDSALRAPRVRLFCRTRRQ